MRVLITATIVVLAGCGKGDLVAPEPAQEQCPQAGDFPPCAPDQTRRLSEPVKPLPFCSRMPAGTPCRVPPPNR